MMIYIYIDYNYSYYWWYKPYYNTAPMTMEIPIWESIIIYPDKYKKLGKYLIIYDLLLSY